MALEKFDNEKQKVLDFLRESKQEKDSLLLVLKENTESNKNLKTAIDSLIIETKAVTNAFKNSIPIKVVFWIFGIVALLIGGIDALKYFFPH